MQQEASDEIIGTLIGGCQIIKLIGDGGMARVYQGRQDHLDREVAVKVLPPYYITDPTFIDRFQQEAKAMAKLVHPNIVIIYDAGKQGQWLYMVMELITGGNLRERMTRSMSLAEVSALFTDVAEALSFAHERGIIHRDVKPVNVLLDNTRQTPFPRAVLSDFGIAKVIQSAEHMTRTGAGVGTPEYMAPEQVRGGPVDARTDIYAMGVMLYEMLCGRPPFEAEEYTAIAHSHVYEQVPSPTLYNPRISPPVQSVILRALQKRPEQRFQSAREMAQALAEAIQANPMRIASRPVTVLCENCGMQNPVGMNFCQRCGTNLRGGPPAPMPSTLGTHLPPSTCQRCGAVNPGINKFCTRCGNRLTVVVCPNCGRANPPGQGQCVACGQALTVPR